MIAQDAQVCGCSAAILPSRSGARNALQVRQHLICESEGADGARGPWLLDESLGGFHLAAELRNDALTMTLGWVVPQEIDERRCPDAFVRIVKRLQQRVKRVRAIHGGEDR
jgi:hypothetical protein